MYEHRSETFECGGISISAQIIGAGPPVLLLHGYPQNKRMWHKIAPLLAPSHTVVMADLRGYGDSDKPGGDVYSKREMADDQLTLMRALGFPTFAIVGHDRGARVGHRLMLDNPESVSSLAVLDIVPSLHMFEHVDRAMATSYYHWFFLAQQGGLPEALIAAAPRTWLESRFRNRAMRADAIDPSDFEDYLRCFDDATIAASCADYRAASTVDLEHDRADRARGRRVESPVLALWGESSYVGRHFDVVEVWRGYAPRATGAAIAADHYLAEESPRETADALLPFLARTAAT